MSIMSNVLWLQRSLQTIPLQWFLWKGWSQSCIHTYVITLACRVAEQGGRCSVHLGLFPILPYLEYLYLTSLYQSAQTMVLV